MPRTNAFDSTFALLADPYRFIGNECAQRATDLFETRILLRPTICMHGARAAEVFYDPARFERANAAPEPLRATLFGSGGVQGLDGAAHRHRKAMFLTILAPESVDRLADETMETWLASVRDWCDRDVALYPAIQQVLTCAVCRWAGVPLPDAHVAMRTRQLVALFDETANSLLGHVRSRIARVRLERWLAGFVEDIRSGRHRAPEGSAAAAVANHLGLDGRPLPARIAAVELLNVVRPAIAVSVFIVFAAHALAAHPECREPLRRGMPGYLDGFVQEVRRTYPFFPAVIARVRHDFVWDDYAFPEGRRVLLDLYGTNHDARSWTEPDAFRPERFAGSPVTPFNFVPQGGADARSNHRCPGEGLAIALMRMSVEFLTNHLEYEVPAQSLALDYSRLPAMPRDGFVIRCGSQTNELRGAVLAART